MPKSVAKKLKQIVVSFVRDAAQRVSGYDNALAEIDCIQHGRKNTHIRFPTGNYDRIYPTILQVLMKMRLREGRIEVFVDNLSRRN